MVVEASTSRRSEFHNEDSFRAQKIQIRVTARSGIDDGGKISGEIVGVAGVNQRKGNGGLQGNLGFPNEFAVAPKLTVNGDFFTGRSRIQE